VHPIGMPDRQECMELVVPDPSFAGSFFVRVCRDIAKIGNKPAAGLSPKIDDKCLSPMTINFYRQ